jgi:hypothetical protein
VSASTHAVTRGTDIGTASMELKNVGGATASEELVNVLRRLDGVDMFSLILWALPPGVWFDDVDPETFVVEYIQCAGSFAGRLTCEIRASGKQYVLGRAQPEGLLREAVVEWNGIRTSVLENEVLDGEAVTELFLAYLAGDEMPPSYSLREISLDPQGLQSPL